jgi:hypothetical protein
MHVLTANDAPGEDASRLLENIDAPDHLAQAAAIDDALQVCFLSLAYMDDREDDYATARPFSFAEDPCIADIPHSASWIIAAAALEQVPDGPHQVLLRALDPHLRQACTSCHEFYSDLRVQSLHAALYLCYVLQELELTETEPTLLYIDNQMAMHMINDNKPTPCSRHIDIQHFAIQEWRDEGILKVVHIPGVLNPSDAATKALASQLHQRHVRQLMGHHGRPNF